VKRRSPDVSTVGYPAKLDVFDVADWYVTDPDDPIEEQYARIRWHIARKEFAEGGDWESHLLPPPWWELRNN
jgi:hypothetical protein